VTYLFDTVVLSETSKRERAHPAVAAWFARTAPDELYLPAVVLGEIRFGIESVRRRSGARAAELEAWLAAVRSAFRDRILPVDAEVGERWGVVRAQADPPPVDGLIAATAIVHDKILVTRNVRDFERTGVRLLDPYGGGA
jgi:toxin FitB